MQPRNRKIENIEKEDRKIIIVTIIIINTYVRKDQERNKRNIAEDRQRKKVEEKKEDKESRAMERNEKEKDRQRESG